MADEILVAIWNQAPFQGSIIRGIEILNKHLETKNIPIKYEPVLVAVKKPVKTDIFILDGGEDVDPARYGEKNNSSHFSKTRDNAEFALTEWYNRREIRMSGICRGHQLLNVYFGGNLWQDITKEGIVNHKEGHISGHKVYVDKKNKVILPAFVGTNAFTVSSLHHQAVKKYGNRIRQTLSWRPPSSKKNSYSSRYVIEGIESNDGKIRGLQSHPEFRGYPKDGQLFAYLMHVDNFTRKFVEPDMKKLEDRHGKQQDINYNTIDSPQPERPFAVRTERTERPVIRNAASLAERYRTLDIGNADIVEDEE